MKMTVVAVVAVVLILGSELPRYSSAVSIEAEEFVSAHNAARADVDVGPLVWSHKLEDYALKYGEEQRDHHNCAMVHSRGPYGENLFWGYGKPFAPADAVRSWVDEKQHYDYDSNSCAPGKVCGHYTQVVWADTKEVGCASITCRDKATFIICSYNPPGNFVGEWPYKRAGTKHSHRRSTENDDSRTSSHKTIAQTTDDANSDRKLRSAHECMTQCMNDCFSMSGSSHHHRSNYYQ